ncbi:hypothetical protein J6590_014364 [Homalodisca vitripennis]|nr:hypothetical protein J6590_014364 [Homalodisca vitripennis]
MPLRLIHGLEQGCPDEEIDKTDNFFKMPYNYKRLPRSRKYADYSNEHLQTCLETIRSGEMTEASCRKFQDTQKHY